MVKSTFMGMDSKYQDLERKPSPQPPDFPMILTTKAASLDFALPKVFPKLWRFLPLGSFVHKWAKQAGGLA